MKLLNYLEPLLKGNISTDYYTEMRESAFLNRIKNNYNVHFDSSKEVILLIYQIKGEKEVLLEKLKTITKTKKDNFWTAPEKEIDDKIEYLNVQINFLKKIHGYAEEWEMYYPGENKETSVPEMTRNDDEFPKLEVIIDKLNKEIKRINKQKLGQNNYRGAIAKATRITINQIEGLESDILGKENQSAVESEFILNWGKMKNAPPVIYRKIYDLIKDNLIISWERDPFVQKMGKT
jgi:hypothetical protein